MIYIAETLCEHKCWQHGPFGGYSKSESKLCTKNKPIDWPCAPKRLKIKRVSGCFALRIFFRIINDFVHGFFLDRTFVDFTVSLLILPFYIVDLIETVKP
jgi:hypothetical protein